MITKWFFIYAIACVVVAAVIWLVLLAAVVLLAWRGIAAAQDHAALRRQQDLLR